MERPSGEVHKASEPHQYAQRGLEDLPAQAETFEAAYPRLFRRAYQAAYRILGSGELSDDVAQEALARCLMRWRSCADYADAFATRVATNLAIDSYRRNAKEPNLDAPKGPKPADEQVILRADLVRALRKLSSRQRDVVVLRYLY